jgi:hypothetical protein
MAPWINFNIACSHFSKEELNEPTNRHAKRQLQTKIIKLLKQRKADPNKPINQFLYDNRNIKY